MPLSETQWKRPQRGGKNRALNRLLLLGFGFRQLRAVRALGVVRPRESCRFPAAERNACELPLVCHALAMRVRAPDRPGPKYWRGAACEEACSGFEHRHRPRLGRLGLAATSRRISGQLYGRMGRQAYQAYSPPRRRLPLHQKLQRNRRFPRACAMIARTDASQPNAICPAVGLAAGAVPLDPASPRHARVLPDPRRSEHAVTTIARLRPWRRPLRFRVSPLGVVCRFVKLMQVAEALRAVVQRQGRDRVFISGHSADVDGNAEPSPVQRPPHQTQHDARCLEEHNSGLGAIAPRAPLIARAPVRMRRSHLHNGPPSGRTPPVPSRTAYPAKRNARVDQFRNIRVP